jgi:tetratricopeptide (TPR) repeat protein
LQIYDEQLYPEMFHADKGHVHMSLAGVAYARGSYEEALSMLQTEAEPQFRKHEQAMSVTASDETAPALPHPDWFQCLQHQGLVSRGMDEFSQALEFYEKARVALRNLGTHQLSTEEGRIQRQSVELDLADMHLVLDHFEEALSLYRSIWEADRIARRGEDGDVPVTALDGLMLHNIGRILVQQGRNDEAVKTLRDAADLKKAWFGGMHPDVSKTLQILGAVYARQEDNYAALKCFKQCLTIARIQAGGDERDPGVMLALRNIALVQGKDVPRWNDNDQNDSH